MSEKISVEYLTLLRQSNRQFEAAQAVNQFVQQNLVAVYKLKDKDSVNILTGEITREQKPDLPSNGTEHVHLSENSVVTTAVTS